MKRASGVTDSEETREVSELLTSEKGHSYIGYVSPDEVTPNPLHPRDDWHVVDEDLRHLAQSMDQIGQKSACLVTLVDRERFPDLAAQDLRYMLIDGHRRYAAARLGGLQLQVVLRTRPGLKPVGPVDALLHWLGVHSGQKQPTRFQILICLTRIRIGWEEENGETFPGSVRIVARLTGSSPSTVSRLSRILDGPVEVCRAFADGLIPEKMALVILDKIDDPEAQVAMVRRIIAENKLWGATDAGPLTVEDVEQMIKPPQQQVQLVASPLMAGQERQISADFSPPSGVAAWVRDLRRDIQRYEELVLENALPEEVATYFDPLTTPQFQEILDRLESRQAQE